MQGLSAYLFCAVKGPQPDTLALPGVPDFCCKFPCKAVHIGKVAGLYCASHLTCALDGRVTPSIHVLGFNSIEWLQIDEERCSRSPHGRWRTPRYECVFPSWCRTAESLTWSLAVSPSVGSSLRTAVGGPFKMEVSSVGASCFGSADTCPDGCMTDWPAPLRLASAIDISGRVLELAGLRLARCIGPVFAGTAPTACAGNIFTTPIVRSLTHSLCAEWRI